MSDKASIYAAFVLAQKEFAPALKSASNPHFKSKYADLAACVEAVIDALNNHGIALIQRPVLCDSGVTVKTLFVHSSGEDMDGGDMHVPAAKQDPQGYGSALTYARRYGLMAACGIAPEDDDGNAAAEAVRARPARAPAATRAITDPAVLIKAMEATKTLTGLQAAFASAWKASNHDQSVKDTYDRLKGLYEGTQA